MDAKDRLGELIERKKELFISLSDDVWGYAETRFGTRESADRYCRLLEEEGFSIERPVAGMANAFIASYGKGRPVIALLAEYDALANLSQAAGKARREWLCVNGNGHGCGHNALGSGVLAAAVGLKDHIKESGLEGTVRLYGCPAEEGGSGKAFMVKAGCFADVDASLTWHPGVASMVYPGGMLAVGQIYFTFTGTASHAAAAPERGRSALDAAELMNIGVNFLREHIIDQARIHYAFTDAGGKAPNVVQPTAQLLYFIRAPKARQVLEIYKRVEKIARGAALMTETEVDIRWDSACSDYIPDETIGKALQGNLEKVLPLGLTEEENAFEKSLCDTAGPEARADKLKVVKENLPDLSMEEAERLADMPVTDFLFPLGSDPGSHGSTDVGDVSYVVPTAQMMLACEPAYSTAHSWQWVANGKSSVVHKGLVAAGKALAFTAYDLLTDPGLLARAKEGHKAAVGEDGYLNLIPDGVVPEE